MSSTFTMDRAAFSAVSDVCEDFLRGSHATCALLVGQDGMLLHRCGAVADLEVDSLSALAAGSFASGREMAALIGEPTFDVAIQQGRRNHLQFLRVGDEALLVAVFDDQTTAAMVRMHGQRAAQRLAAVFTGGAEAGRAAAAEATDGGPAGFVQQTQERTAQLRSALRLRTVSLGLALLAAIVAVLGALLRH